jgi:hypothetical protein
MGGGRGGLTISEAVGLGDLVVQVLVHGEEVLDLRQQRRQEVGEILHVGPGRVAQRHAEHLLVHPLGVAHHEDPDRAYLDPAAGEGRLADEHEGVERVAVAAERALDEPVVGRVPGRREQHPIEVDLTGLVVELVLVP